MLTARSFDRRYYDEHAEHGLDYAAYSDWQEKYGRWFVGALGLEGRLVLDVGCACGAIARGIERAGAFQCVGVELNEHMVSIGRKQWPNMRLHVCDAVNLHLFTCDTFDAIHCAQVAEHWNAEHVPLILAELLRVTRPGGVFFCALDTTELYDRQGRDELKEDPTHRCLRPLAWWHEQAHRAGWHVDTGDITERLKAHPLWGEFAGHDWDWFCAEK